jgi:hypothetical protein
VQREEAVSLLREISAICRDLSPNYVSLVKSQPNDQFSSGYQLRIQAHVDQETERQITSLSALYHLEIHHQQGKALIIYKPKAPQP